MLFNSLTYLLFLSFILVIYWMAPHRFRLMILLVGSYFFYMSWKAEYGLLLFGLTLVNYFAGLLVKREGAPASQNRLVFIAAVAINLSMLALFKYTNFFIDSSFSLAGFLTGAPALATSNAAKAAELPIILPLGISFFVFEFIHYLTDIYKGKAPPIKNPLRFGVFAAFFPSQIAGPIKRFEDFDRQVGEVKRFSAEQFQAGLFLIIQGTFKKVVLGDNLARLVQVGFDHCHGLSSLDAWAAVAAFTLQIYYDFSGYTDIGIGSAKMLGYQLPENFNMPYIAKNMSEFWHRWHISLSTWLRDYLYIPLGGSRQGKVMQMRNLCLTMLLGGLWHGASWTFVLWGAFHGLGLIICHTWEAVAKRVSIFQNQSLQPVWNAASWAITLLFVMFGWVLFRAQNMDQVAAITGAMLNPFGVSAYDCQVFRMFFESTLPLAFSLYLIFNLYQRFASSRPEIDGMNWTQRWWVNIPPPLRVAVYAGSAVLISGLAPTKSIPFIYFQF